MDLSFTPEEEAFRAEVRAFLAEKYPKRLADKVRQGKRLTKADQEEWHAILNARGWLANHWPKEYGGTGWTPGQSFIFDTECALAATPRIVPFGLSMLGPVLIKFGTEEQKARWLPRILDGSDWWSQGYSEPGSGSDLASVKTTAVRGIDAQGDHYIVNGQKTWTTLGQHGNMIFCLVRTDPKAKKQEGISFLLVDMKAPGVEVRPIVTLDGDREVNEVFFTDVRVPAENLVGQEHRGWTCAKYLLTYERTNIAGIGGSMAALGRLKQVAAKQRKNGRPLAEDPAFAARLARVEIELENMKTTNLRVIAAVEGGGVPGAESSMLKIRGTQIQQELSSLYRRAMGPYALPFIEAALEDEHYDAPAVGPAGAAYAAAKYFNMRKTSIYGGSNEIQRNIISKMILGL
ncbi:acyl-CoA dehydrogenase family protein [Ottowia sp.]|jgi:alkylation response protein AidB-like acyl-CoA dehydrogenase|uniref:acyl-CoA dehydrogenase family protein n=1 Tax=Ottowia sp. TaxID=1898956 RepID=UPI0025D68E58|nr:acyl-CoA dehydrogenase family protein [Ottowia sp.]MBK6615403.1 acyl-CoA dehydrogenase family protein [Ottowia sp.]